MFDIFACMHCNTLSQLQDGSEPTRCMLAHRSMSRGRSLSTAAPKEGSGLASAEQRNKAIKMGDRCIFCPIGAFLQCIHLLSVSDSTLTGTSAWSLSCSVLLYVLEAWYLIHSATPATGPRGAWARRRAGERQTGTSQTSSQSTCSAGSGPREAQTGDDGRDVCAAACYSVVLCVWLLLCVCVSVLCYCWA